VSKLVEVENLRVSFGRSERDRREVVSGVSLSLEEGECLAIVGESGSGKSVTARTLVGLTGGHSHVVADRLAFGDIDLRSFGGHQWQRIRGKEIGFILQDALVSLDRLRPVGLEIAEPLRLHGWGDRASRRARVVELLTEVGVPEPEVRAHQRSTELSGGLRQRALIASAIALDPRLVIADEPTTALDVTVQAQILDLLEKTKERGRALILISHDLAVVARLADRVAVMYGGEILEEGPTLKILNDPETDYTRALLAAVPSAHSKGTRLSVGGAPPRASGQLARLAVVSEPAGDGQALPPAIVAHGLVKRYLGPDGRTRTVVDDVSFTLAAGETLGVVGESGSGKTTTARIVLAMLAPDEGEVLLHGRPWTTLSERERRPQRHTIGTVYQDPLSSFDPRWSVERILDDSVRIADGDDKAQREERIHELLALVGLGAEHRGRRPLQLSGGQRQRVAIARALAHRPSVIVCDEPVSALDVSIQAQVLDLLADLQSEFGLSYLFVSHDLGVVHHVSDNVIVMKDGVVVERGPVEDIFNDPQERYTQELVEALPTLPVRGVA
jgi:peptide/nickel transport system ATP-binding protein